MTFPPTTPTTATATATATTTPTMPSYAPVVPPAQSPFASPAPRYPTARLVLLAAVVVLLSVALPATLPSAIVSARTAAFPKPMVSIAMQTSTATIQVGDPVTLGATVTAGTDLQYTWDFGDASSATGPRPEHIYQQYGDYTVTLTVRDPIGQTGEATSDLRVLPTPPSASFTYSVDPSYPLNASFDASNSSGAQLSFQWDFGDGTTDSGLYATHQYAKLGTYTVTLTTTDVARQTATIQQQVQIVVPQPTASFTTSTSYFGCVSFDASASKGYQLQYIWDFGDGNTTTDNYSSSDYHCYSSNGSYAVKLTVRDAADQSASTSQSVNVG